MLKMFSTQLTGLLKRIAEKEALNIEDSARLLAQAVVGQGTIYLYGEKEMNAVISEALYSVEPLQKVKRWDGTDASLTIADRVLIFARFADDENAVKAGKWLVNEQIPFVAVSTDQGAEGDNLVELADVHLDLQLKKGLLPHEDGSRFGYPASIAALFIYHNVKFLLDEIMMDY